MQFNFNTLGGLFRSFKSPIKETIASDSLRLQQRGSEEEPIFALRLRTFGNLTYHEMDIDELRQLRNAINEMIDID